MSDQGEPPVATDGRTCNVERCRRPIVVWWTRQGMRAFDRQAVARADDVEGYGFVPLRSGVGSAARFLAVPVRDLSDRRLAGVEWVLMPHLCRVLQAMTERRVGRDVVAQLGDGVFVAPPLS